MEVYRLKNDLKIFCVTAKSFPYEIKQAFGTLINKLPSVEDRTFFGISYQSSTGDMIYKAAVLESYQGEGEKLGCEPFTIKKGEYLAETLKNWKKDETQIGATFRKFSESTYHATFPCVEWYQGDDVMCMVKLNPSSK
jgi:predicted transcriptional regulator YdeE